MRYRFPVALAASLTLLIVAACSPKAPTPSPAPEPTVKQEGLRVALTPLPSDAKATDTRKSSANVDKVKQRLAEKLGDIQGEPDLKIYVVANQSVETMPIEKYLEGVLAGEMKNDWPLEALKAQAILARTFALKFIEDKESQYEGAHLSTDIKEAQAYDEEGINERIAQAIEETRGQVLVYDDDVIFSWFHAHAGGMTALAKEGMNYKDADPPYLHIIKSPDSPKAPAEDAQWEATFSADAFIAAAQKSQGLEISGLESIEVGEHGDSGRVTTLLVNGESVNAPDLRVALDSMKMKSTLLTSIRLENGQVVMAGKGYGHGVGMSQWGAYAMAEDEGKSAEEIVKTYFKDVDLIDLW